MRPPSRRFWGATSTSPCRRRRFRQSRRGATMLRLPFFAGGRGGGSPQPTAGDFPPARVLQVELSQPISHLEAVDSATGRQYRQALVLARLHGRPLGVVTLDLPAGGLAPR